MSFSFNTIVQDALEGKQFSSKETAEIFDAILSNSVPHIQIAALLIILRMRGETAEELEGAVLSMRHHMLSIPVTDPYTIDVCGTGGDGHSTLNISTAVSFVLAALGVSVAKHGNRAQSSKAGGVDVLASLGILPETDFEILQNTLHDHKITFLSAFVHHPALKDINHLRKELGVRTIFNLLGPLSNPANVQYQMIGVYSAQWLKPFIHVLRNLGSKRAWVVHGLIDSNGVKQGVDEITLAGPSKILALENDHIIPVTLSLQHIESTGLTPSSLADIQGGSPEENANAMIALFNGQRGAYRDTVLLNTAIALHIARDNFLINSHGEMDSAVLKKLVLEAAKAIDSGAALSILQTVQKKFRNNY